MNASTELRDELQAYEDRRCALLMAGDEGTLDGLLDESLAYTHSIGVRDGKAAFLALLASGTIHYLELRHTLEHVDGRGDIAWGVGQLTGRLDTPEGARPIAALTSAVWVKADEGGWLLASFHATQVRVGG